MKKTVAILFAAAVSSFAVFGQNDSIFSISTGPGEDVSSQMGISWSTDTLLLHSYLLLEEETAQGWENAIKFLPQQQQRCTVFDGVWSDNAAGEEFYEDVVFTKCGLMLTGLKPDTEYRYVIKGENGECSSVHHFRTAGAKRWAACLISDFHSYPPLPQRLEAAMSMISTVKEHDPSVSWVFSPGDVVAWGGSYSFWRRLFEEKKFEELMWARVNGNHDNWTKESQVTHNFDIPNDYFTGTSFFPQNGYWPEMGVCYHFRYGNTLFLMLNTEDMHKSGEFEAASQWVRSVVGNARRSADPPTFVVACMHWEWFIGTNGRTSEYREWSPVFDEVGVDLALAGNNHVYLRTLPLYKGQKTDGRRNGTVYLQTPSSDNGRGREISTKEFHNSELIEKRWSEGAHTVGAIHMAVDNKTINLTLLDREGNEIDHCVVYAKKAR